MGDYLKKIIEAGRMFDLAMKLNRPLPISLRRKKGSKKEYYALQH